MLTTKEYDKWRFYAVLFIQLKARAPYMQHHGEDKNSILLQQSYEKVTLSYIAQLAAGTVAGPSVA